MLILKTCLKQTPTVTLIGVCFSPNIKKSLFRPKKFIKYAPWQTERIFILGTIYNGAVYIIRGIYLGVSNLGYNIGYITPLTLIFTAFV